MRSCYLFHFSYIRRYQFVTSMFFSKKLKIWGLSIIQVLTFSQLTAQNTPEFKILRFHSQLEKNIFTNYETNKILDTIGIFMTVDPTSDEEKLSDIKKKILTVSDDFYKGYANKNSGSRFIKDLFHFTHKKFLKKYELESYFNTLNDGTYNCVTASALYAMAFSRYHVPYSIKEAPTHVYLIADPGGMNITIETTSPNAGYFLPDEKYKKHYLDYLLDGKSITQEEINTLGKNAAFQKYYYDQDDISLIQLAGLQYYNYGVALMQKQQYNDAFDQLTKAYYLYPSNRIKMLLNEAAGAQLSGAHMSDTADVNLYTRAYLYQQGKKAEDILVHNFGVITQRFLIEKNNEVYYDTIYERLVSSISDTSLIKRISFIFYSQKGRISYLSGNFEKATSNLLTALTIDKEQHETIGFLALIILEKASSKAQCGDMLYSYFSKYDFLHSNKKFTEEIYRCYLKQAGELFMINNKKSGNEYLKKSEEFANIYDVSPDSEAIGFAYGNGSSLCVRNREYTQAKNYLQRGLKISPYNTELLRKLTTLNDYLKQ